jgi:hypothetical protein
MLYSSYDKLTSRLLEDLEKINKRTNKQYKDMFNRYPERLLSIDLDAKTIKGNKKGFKTGILYLAPADTVGFYNLCPNAMIAECIKACLFTAGRGRFTDVELSRIRKTLYWIDHKERFLDQLYTEIKREAIKANKNGYKFVVRLNGTSDIRFENYFYDQMLELNKLYGVVFYDYTKIANRKIKDKKVYDLTFSYSGVKSLQYQQQIKKAVDNGMRLAAVWRKKELFPSTFLNRKVVPGDETDLRFLDPVNSVVALYAKGSAIKDYSGFVLD